MKESEGMKIVGTMMLVNTKKWLVTPTRGYSFRVGSECWYCMYRLGRFALIQYVGDFSK